MPTDDGSNQGSSWPMPTFRFEVDFKTDIKGVAFQEVSGLEAETHEIEYRSDNSKVFKIPGINKYSNVTMKRGLFVNDNSFRAWHNEMKLNAIKRRTVLIKLLDEDGKVTVQWQLLKAWLTKFNSSDLKSDGNEVAVDTIEIAHEGMKITYGK